jgi:hypothetical protein
MLTTDDMDDDLWSDNMEEMRFIFSRRKQTRSIKYKHQRINWDDYVEKIIYTNKFEQRFRMPLSAFHYLLEELRESITVLCLKSTCSTSGNEPIYPEVIVTIGLRFLGVGDTHSSLADTYGMSDASAYCIVDMFLDAVDYNEPCKALRVELPRSDSKLNEVAQRWCDVSTCPINMLNEHIGAIDGWFVQTEMPHYQTNQADYCSGHYQLYGLNVQAICKPDLLFLYIAVAGPGKINNNCAFSRLRELHNWIQSLPPWCFLSADGAYGLTRRVMIPFNAAELLGEGHRTYNFYLSQLRIRIEMAFGLLTTKWRKIRSFLNYSMPKNTQIIRVCTKLHNFVIHMAQAKGNGNGRIGQFHGNNVNPWMYGIEPMGAREFGYLPS